MSVRRLKVAGGAMEGRTSGCLICAPSEALRPDLLTGEKGAALSVAGGAGIAGIGRGGPAGTNDHSGTVGNSERDLL